MRKSIRANTKPKRGRPKTTGKGVLIGVRVQPLLLDALDKFISESARDLSRPEAIRDLLADELVTLGILRSTKDTTDH